MNPCAKMITKRQEAERLQDSCPFTMIYRLEVFLCFLTSSISVCLGIDSKLLKAQPHICQKGFFQRAARLGQWNAAGLQVEELLCINRRRG